MERGAILFLCVILIAVAIVSAEFIDVGFNAEIVKVTRTGSESFNLLIRNKGTTDINLFSIVLEDVSGQTKSYIFGGPIRPFETKSYFLDFSGSNLGEIKKLSLVSPKGQFVIPYIGVIPKYEGTENDIENVIEPETPIQLLK